MGHEPANSNAELITFIRDGDRDPRTARPVNYPIRKHWITRES